MRQARSHDSRGEPFPEQPRTPAILRLLRPKQWPKNVLVFAAPFAAGRVLEGRILVHSLLAFGAFCLAASGSYCVNDAMDAEADRRHPEKRLRPVAAGALPPATAVVIGVVLLGASFAIAATVRAQLLLVVGCYVALTLAYSWQLKHIAVVDLAAVAAGFVLRSVAGGAAAPVVISQWFLIVAGFGSLFMVAGKRHAEHLDLGHEGAAVRTTLGLYSIEFLRFVRGVAAAGCLVGYCLWAFERANEGAGAIWFQLSIVPFVLGVLHYALRLEQGAGAVPEELVLEDRTLQVIGVLWLALFALGVHAG